MLFLVFESRFYIVAGKLLRMILCVGQRMDPAADRAGGSHPPRQREGGPKKAVRAENKSNS